jgi:2'-5' RNA ligase
VRAFLAINLDPALREEIHRDAGVLRAAAPEVSWVRAEALHMTIRFLGEIEDAMAGALVPALHDVAARHRSFTLELAGAGTYPNFRHPRVVWIGVREDAAVAALARDVEARCVALGLPAERRPFSAHLTLGRVRREPGRDRLQALEHAAGRFRTTYSIGVSRFELMRSETGPGGSRYDTVAGVPLAS